MSTSTNGQICYGIAFEQDAEFPWDERGDIEDWWVYDVLGFKHSFELFDDNGNYINGVKPSEERPGEYFDERQEFWKNKPLPVEIVNYCSCDRPVYILAVPGTMFNNYRGDAVQFEPKLLRVDTEKKEAFLDFCRKHGIETDG